MIPLTPLYTVLSKTTSPCSKRLKTKYLSKWTHYFGDLVAHMNVNTSLNIRKSNKQINVSEYLHSKPGDIMNHIHNLYLDSKHGHTHTV